MNSELAAARNKKIVYDFHNTDMTRSEIAVANDCSEATVSGALKGKKRRYPVEVKSIVVEGVYTSKGTKVPIDERDCPTVNFARKAIMEKLDSGICLYKEIR